VAGAPEHGEPQRRQLGAVGVVQHVVVALDEQPVVRVGALARELGLVAAEVERGAQLEAHRRVAARTR
jgi:hypothetical protein